MKANENTVIVGSRLILVPYRAEHVPKYHEWMLNEELRELTASEPLSLEEEYQMQERWQVDEDKLTFIILSGISKESEIETLPGTLGELQPGDARLTNFPMIGDVNIFLHGVPPLRLPDESEDEGFDSEFYAEVEIMIAEPAYRRKGLALEALQLILGYATGKPDAFSAGKVHSHLHTFSDSPLNICLESLVTKISETNVASIKLFEKLGFVIKKRVEIFQEVEMRYKSV